MRSSRGGEINIIVEYKQKNNIKSNRMNHVKRTFNKEAAME